MVTDCGLGVIVELTKVRYGSGERAITGIKPIEATNAATSEAVRIVLFVIVCCYRGVFYKRMIFHVRNYVKIFHQILCLNNFDMINGGKLDVFVRFKIRIL